jgi:hypothetical protein
MKYLLITILFIFSFVAYDHFKYNNAPKDENIFLSFQRYGYEFVDYVDEKGKVYHVLPDQSFWNEYGYYAARNGLYLFYFCYGNKPIDIPKGIYAINQDNGVLYVNEAGKQIDSLIKVL